MGRGLRFGLVFLVLCALSPCLPPESSAVWNLSDKEAVRLTDVLVTMKQEAAALRKRGLGKDADELDSSINELASVKYMRGRGPDYAYTAIGNIFVNDSLLGIDTGSDDPEITRKQRLAQGALLLHELIHARHQWPLEWDEKTPYSAEYKYLRLFGITEADQPAIWQNLQENMSKAYGLTNALKLEPRYADLGLGGSQEFKASFAGTERPHISWEVAERAAGGSIMDLVPDAGLSAGGQFAAVYTAPQTVGVYHVVVMRRDPGTGAESLDQMAMVNVREMEVSVSPARVVMFPGETLQFTASVRYAPAGTSQEVVWEVPAGGRITPDGEYTAPSEPGTYRVTAASAQDGKRKGESVVTVQVPTVSISPAGPITMKPGQQKGFTATVRDARVTDVRWTADGGKLPTPEAPYLYYGAPTQPGTYTLTAASAKFPRSKDAVKIIIPGEQKPQPQPPAGGAVPEDKTPPPSGAGVSFVLTEFSIPGQSMRASFITISPPALGVVILMVNASFNPLAAIAMPSMQVQLNVSKITGPGTYALGRDATQDAACVVYSGGLSAKGVVYSSIGGTLALREWSLQPGGRISGTFEASMADTEDASRRGSIKGRFSVTTASGGPL